MTVKIELPAALVEHFRASGQTLDAAAAAAIRFGADPSSRPPEPTGPANDPDPERRRRQALDAVLHYAGRYWYLALLVPRLAREVDELNRELDELERANAD